MRFMVMIRANKDTEAGVPPSKELLAAMGRFNEEMVKAGVMLGGEGLQPSSKGTRVSFHNGKRTVVDGPFAETKELIAGFWLLKAKSKEEVLEWVYRIPGAKGEIDHFGGTFEIEVRQLFEIEDFPADVFPPEEAAREQALRDELERKAKR